MTTPIVSFIGLGAMGQGMAQVLIGKGFVVRGYDVRKFTAFNHKYQKLINILLLLFSIFSYFLTAINFNVKICFLTFKVSEKALKNLEDAGGIATKSPLDSSNGLISNL